MLYIERPEEQTLITRLRQNKTRQDKNREDKTKIDKTKQDKNKTVVGCETRFAKDNLPLQQ